MINVLNLYVDDSGSRKPDRQTDSHASRNWFGLGGLLVRDDDEQTERARHEALIAKWPEIQGIPLHSVDIRNKARGFSWLRDNAERANAFYESLTEFICGSSIVCIAAVIDRDGYRARYEPKYEPGARWLLCKTAFTILLERAAKYALSERCRLRVLVERSDKKTDRRMLSYYEDLRAKGMPFDPKSMAGYAPLDATTLGGVLYEFRKKEKTSPLMQVADLCLYPICRARYEPYQPFTQLLRHGRLIDTRLKREEVASRGIKYSCFELVDARREAAEPGGS